MTEVFADTFYFSSMVGSSGVENDNALRATLHRSRMLVTTVWVLAELANSLSRPQDRGAFLRTYNALVSDEQTVVTGCN